MLPEFTIMTLIPECLYLCYNNAGYLASPAIIKSCPTYLKIIYFSLPYTVKTFQSELQVENDVGNVTFHLKKLTIIPSSCHGLSQTADGLQFRLHIAQTDCHTKTESSKEVGNYIVLGIYF